MKPIVGKVVVTGIIAVILIPILLYAEFHYGFYQKFRFEQKADHYLTVTYDEEMTLVSVRYLWDNIEPLLATVHPKSDPSLRFNVTVSKTRASGFSDSYATTLWEKQATQEAATLLQNVSLDEYARFATIDFTCCEVAEYDFASIKGKVPDYGTTGLPLDLIIRLERPILEADPGAMFQAVTALRESSELSLGKLVFLFEPPPGGGSVSYELLGSELEAVCSWKDMEGYNRTRLPARDIADRIGASLQWDEEKHEAVFRRGETTLVVRSWGDEAILNGQPIADLVGAHIGDSMALMVPVALIEQAFGQKLELW